MLKPRGHFFFKTPNRFHYVVAISRYTPYWFHRLAARLRGSKPEDTFPTLYRANSKRGLIGLATQARLVVTSLDMIEGRPEYLKMNALAYLFGMAYERLVNSADFFSCLRCVIIGHFTKPVKS